MNEFECPYCNKEITKHHISDYWCDEPPSEGTTDIECPHCFKIIEGSVEYIWDYEFTPTSKAKLMKRHNNRKLIREFNLQNPVGSLVHVNHAWKPNPQIDIIKAVATLRNDSISIHLLRNHCYQPHLVSSIPRTKENLQKLLDALKADLAKEIESGFDWNVRKVKEAIGEVANMIEEWDNNND